MKQRKITTWIAHWTLFSFCYHSLLLSLARPSIENAYSSSPWHSLCCEPSFKARIISSDLLLFFFRICYFLYNTLGSEMLAILSVTNGKLELKRLQWKCSICFFFLFSFIFRCHLFHSLAHWCVFFIFELPRKLARQFTENRKVSLEQFQARTILMRGNA